MKTDSAHVYWDAEWQKADATSKWAKAEAEVMGHAAALPEGARVLDLGAGIGRHALALARAVGEYGSVIFIAGNIPLLTEIAPLLIIIQLEEFNYDAAAAIGIAMLLISFAMLA